MADFDFTNPTPGGSSGTWGAELNTILDVIQAHPGIKVVADADAKAAYTPLLGQVVLQADTGKLYKCTNATGPVWVEVGPAATADTTLTTKGDLLIYGSALARLPIGTDGQVLTADSAQALGVKWAAASGGGGGVPERWYVPAGTDLGYDDEFDDGILNGWTAVDVAGYENIWHEVSGLKGLSCHVASGKGDQKITGLVKSSSGLTTPYYIETAINILGPSGTYNVAGLVFADGATMGSGNQVCLAWSTSEEKIEYAVHTGYNHQLSNANYSLHTGRQLNRMYIRMAHTGVNAFSSYVSLDGISWLKLADVTPTITPTHIGITVSGYYSTEFLANFAYFRVKSGNSIEG